MGQQGIRQGTNRDAGPVFDLLIFDLDGTLVDSRRDLAAAVNHMLAALGRPKLPIRTVTRLIGNGITDLLQRALDAPDEPTLLAGKQLFRDYYAAHLTRHTRPYPGIPALLDHLRHATLAVLTNKALEFTIPLLQQLELLDRFSIVEGGRPGWKPKPDPAGVLEILRRTGAAPGRSLLIGDSATDIRAGKAAGVATCAVTYGYRPAAELTAAAPDYLAGSPRALQRALASN